MAVYKNIGGREVYNDAKLITLGSNEIHVPSHRCRGILITGRLRIYYDDTNFKLINITDHEILTLVPEKIQGLLATNKFYELY